MNLYRIIYHRRISGNLFSTQYAVMASSEAEALEHLKLTLYPGPHVTEQDWLVIHEKTGILIFPS